MIEINNLTSFVVDKKFYTGVAKKVLKGENKGKENLSIAFVSVKEIQKLNRRFRKKNKPTDVLSFENDANTGIGLGEIVICPEVAKKNAEKFKIVYKKELAKLLIHGVLHILGYEHEKKVRRAVEMENKQDFYLSKIKF
jgi:probable rRNA maturation factor